MLASSCNSGLHKMMDLVSCFTHLLPLQSTVLGSTKNVMLLLLKSEVFHPKKSSRAPTGLLLGLRFCRRTPALHHVGLVVRQLRQGRGVQGVGNQRQLVLGGFGAFGMSGKILTVGSFSKGICLFKHLFLFHPISQVFHGFSIASS